MSQEMGKVKWFNNKKGFGFIADTDGTEVFFHKSSLKDIDFSALVGNEDVEFEVRKTPKGLNADSVTVVKK